MKKVSLICDSNRNDVIKFENFLAEVNKDFNLSQEKLINFQIASSEALINAIVHGNKQDPDKKVFIEIRYDDTFLELLIKDQGEGFDVSKLPDPTNNENILKEHGRGVYIIRSLVDDYKYFSDSSGTTCILSVKK